MNDTDSAADLFADESEHVVYEKGSWQATLNRSANLFDKSAGERKRATVLLWQGAVSGIEDWLPDASTDVSAEGLYSEVMAILGKPRKGDASKIKTVALATKNHGLMLSLYPNLSKAYAEARRLTQTIAQEKSEDDAANAAVEALAAEAPNTASTPENAAKIVLAAGLDEAARLLLDALGATNDAAHRAFMRAISQEIAGRVKPKLSAVKAGPKAGATQAKPGGAGTKPAAVKTAGTKPKASATGSTKGKPVARPVAAKAKTVSEPAKGEPVSEPVEAGTEHVSTPVVPIKRPVVKGRPVAVKRG